MNSAVQKGKTLVTTIIGVVIAVSVVNGLITNALIPAQPASEIVKDGIRFVLTIALCYFLYQGQGWAKWVLGILLALGGFLSIPAALLVLNASFLGAIWLLVMGAVYLATSWILLRSPEIKAFQSAQRAARSKS
ncbi:hypothetical protein H6F67_22095 [Microcoleus sp. FACHB-1515]|uniref:hypothetical protein n=1 Tax=Cyanophyceae TaxID=3028117 RepID=UPI001682C416|nr:hypothetical protein [Microcoleus sp. FACHB-1515]MBD2092544.1 hypothetical protein [Microcoleus sp. FACHB-1515]